MDKEEFDTLIEASFTDEPDYDRLEEAFRWLAQNIWDNSTYTPRHHDFDAVAEAVLVCMERRKKFGWNRRGKTANDYFTWMINTVYRHHCTWDKNGVKNGLKSKPKPKPKPKKAEAMPQESKRWGLVRKSGWKPKTGSGE
jgi:hypothetical protein